MDSRFSKRQILRCDRFREHRDVLSALLNESHEYGIDEINEIIDEFGDRVFTRKEDDVL